MKTVRPERLKVGAAHPSVSNTEGSIKNGSFSFRLQNPLFIVTSVIILPCIPLQCMFHKMPGYHRDILRPLALLKKRFR